MKRRKQETVLIYRRYLESICEDLWLKVAIEKATEKLHDESFMIPEMPKTLAPGLWLNTLVYLADYLSNNRQVKTDNKSYSSYTLFDFLFNNL